MLDIKLQNQNGVVKVLQRDTYFNASAEMVSLNFGINVGVQINRETKAVTFIKYDGIELDEQMTIEKIKAELSAVITELNNQI